MTREERKDAINSIKAIRKRFLRGYGEDTVVDVPIDGDDMQALDRAISALKGGWIPITEGEKLPEHDVICCDNEGNIALGYLYFDEEENQIACDHDPYVMFGVVAYMELPEPYKEGGECE